MKKITALGLAMFAFQFCSGQLFSFKLYFEDAVGHKDSVEIGYDPAATSSIDAAFGETNIIGTPIDTNFDVRISDEWIARYGGGSGPGTFHTKKQIVNYGCTHYEMFRIDLDIHCNNWPVKAKWDKTLFTDTCRSGFITSMMPGGWFDTGCPSDLLVRELKLNDSVVFTSQTLSGLDYHFNYLMAPGDTASVYWVGIGNGILDGSGIKNEAGKEEIRLFPNPTSGTVNIELKANFREAFLFGCEGKKIPVILNNNQLDLSRLENGVYIVQCVDQNGNRSSHKIIKQH
jgi:hypothetical protein